MFFSSLNLQELLGINEDELKQVLTFNLSSARGDVFQRNYTKHQAQGMSIAYY